MNDDNLTLLQQAQAHARKAASLNVGASTEDGKTGEAHVALNTGWRGWSVVLYAKALLAKGKKPNAAAGFDVTKPL